MASGGTNLGPRSETLVQQTQKQIAKLKKEGITPTTDLVTSSGSGVDPDIAPADAYAQVDSVAKARGLSPAAVRKLVTAHVQGPELGFLGDQYVNVLQLNEALAQMQ
jgi:K+-transporting ATPase ATPase C chain